MFTQFPQLTIKPREYLLKVNEKYSIYFEESGNPNGLPVLFVRGGPGASPNIKEHSWFNPEKYRVIVFDQRGTGRCEPSAEENTPEPNFYADITVDDLVSDMEAIRQHLNIKAWCLFGGSWGSTLALRYAQLNPERVEALILRGIFLCTQDEMKIYFNLLHLQKRFPNIDPRAFNALIKYANSQLGINLTSDNENALLEAYKELIIRNNDTTAMYLWAEFESYMDDFSEKTLHNLLNPVEGAEIPGEARATAISQIILFPQLAAHDCLLDPTQISKLSGLKTYIVQGKQDTTCPPEYAMKLQEALEANHAEVKMILVEDGKHSPYSPSMTHELIKLTSEWAANRKTHCDANKFFSYVPSSPPQEEHGLTPTL